MKQKTYLTKQIFLQDLRQLVAFKTISGQKRGFDEAIKFIQSKINKKAFIKILKNNDSQILLASNRSGKKVDILFLAHLDVVPAADSQFTMTIKGDVAKGRGVSDMKFAIPIGYSLLNEIIATKKNLSFMLAITCDEETGGFNGAKFLADNFQVQPKLAIVPDGGDNFVCIVKNKGVCQIKITSRGKPAHSSRLWLGRNALLPLVAVAHKLTGIYQKNNNQGGWQTTMNLGELHGGSLANQVCDQAYMKLDFRFPPEKDSPQSILAKVRQVALSIDKKLKVEATAIGEPTYTDPNNELCKLFRSSLNKYSPKQVKIAGGYGSTDARHFNKNGVPILMAKPNGGDVHGDNEWISISSTLNYYESLRDFVEEYEKISNK